MGETTIRYHADNMEPARPAIDVKLHGVTRVKLEQTRDLLTNALGEDVTDELFQIAEDRVYGQFWNEDLPRMAQVLGFEIEQAGRSGGWVVITNGDPLNDPDATNKVQKDWVSRYSQLRDFCDRETSEALNRMAETAREIALTVKGRSTVTIRAIEAFRPA